MHTDSAVIELRRYRLRRGRRDELVGLFDGELVEPQEAAGMRVVGQFRDLDEPDHFVWLRGFPGMAARERALRAFYSGPVWREHGPAANATMLDSDDVLLLRPAHSTAAFPPARRRRPARAAAGDGAGAVLVGTHAGTPPARVDAVLERIGPALDGAGGELLAVLVTESAPNTFPALPVREGEQVVVWVAQFGDRDTAVRERAALASAGVDVAVLTPTARSLLPH